MTDHEKRPADEAVGADAQRREAPEPRAPEPSGAAAATAEEASEEPGLEARLQRLDRILARMESDDVELEEALRLFEEGVTHVRRAERILAETELRVEELLSQGTEPMDLDET